MKNVVATLMIAITGFLVLPVTVFADAQADVCANLPDGMRDECLGANDATATDIINTAIDVLSWVIGITSVVVIIIAGLMYVLSAGDPERTKRAKNAIMYALVGVVIALVARVLVQFIISSTV